MPIYLQDSSASINGNITQSLGAFTSSMVGSSATQPDINGRIERSLGSFTARFTDGLINYPRVGVYRIGTRNWGDNPDGTGNNFDVDVDERQAMGYCDFVIIGSQSTRSQGFKDAVGDWLDWRDANSPNCITYDYVDLQEAGDSGSATADKLNAEVGPNGLRDWWTYEDIDFDTKASSFPGAYHTNITTYVTPDSQGEIFPEWYANYVKEQYLTHNTPTNVRVHIFNDVNDHRLRENNMDYNADGAWDYGRRDWNVGGTIGQEVAEKYREGHRIFGDRLRSDTPGIYFTVNNSTWGMESSSESFIQTWKEAPHTFYDKIHDGGVIEHMTHGETNKFPFSGVVSSAAGIQINAFGSWRLAMNQYLAGLMWSTGPGHQIAEWSAWIAAPTSGLDLGEELNPLVGTNMLSDNMRVARWGICSTLMDDGYVYWKNGRRPQNSTPQHDYFGSVNTGTTGLSGTGWLGQPVDASMIEKEFVSGASSRWIGSADTDAMFKREFDNGVVLVNTNKSLSSSADITITVKVGADEDNGELESGKWKLITGAQDPSVDTGATITSNLTIGGIDGRVLERV